MKRHQNILLLYALIISLTACKPDPKEIQIDNPTENPITVKFEQTDEMTILPGEVKTISLIFGKENLLVNRDKKYEILLDNKKDYLLNPSLETYYIQTIAYGTYQGMKHYRNNYGDPKSEVYGMTVEGDFKEIKSKLILEKNWDFSSTETPYGSIQKTSADEYILVKKLHRGSDLMKKFYEELLKFKEELNKK